MRDLSPAQMPDNSFDIFISYRRSDAAGHARALYRDLSQRLDERRIFFDQQSIEAGEVFPDRLREGIASCRVLLALIGPGWLESKTGRGERRLDSEDDFVRQEVAWALQLDKNVIPVLFDDTPMPEAAQLPPSLRALAGRDALMLRGKNFEYNVQLESLVRIIAKILGIPRPIPAEQGRGKHLEIDERLAGKCNSDATQADELDFQVGYLNHLLKRLARRGVREFSEPTISIRSEQVEAASEDEWGFHLLLRQPGDAISPVKRFTGLESTFWGYPKLVLLGEPGSGKTTALRHMACVFARRRLSGDVSVPIPVYLECSSWRYASSLQYFIINAIASLGYSSAVCEFVLNQLITGGAVLLLDGLNEMGSVGATNTSAVSGWLRSDSAPKYLIVSCRSGEFYGSTYIEGLTQIELLPLDPEQIEIFTTAYLGDRAPKFLDSITAIGPARTEVAGSVRRQGLQSLISNSYLLSALIFLFENVPNDSIPYNVGALFSRLSDALFRREELRGSLKATDVPDIKKYLAQLAFSMIDKDKPTSISIQQAQEHMGSDIMIRQAVNAGILTQNEADGTLRFFH